MIATATPLERVLEWIARLPLCGERELAALLSLHEHDARRIVHELSRRGWVESVEPGSAELDCRRRYVVRDRAVTALAAAAGCSDSTRHMPVRWKDTVRRLGRSEITVGVNRLLSDLAVMVREVGTAELADGRSLPVALPAAAHWWLPAVDGYGCFRAGALWAPFFIAWDRASAPGEHRRGRVAAWSRARAAVTQRWGAEGLPPVLVVCPTAREQDVWEEALLARDRDHSPPPTACMTTSEALRSEGVGGTIWRRPGGTAPVPLVELIGWGTQPPVEAPRLTAASVTTLDMPRAGRSIREWALAQAVAPSGGPRWPDAGALSVTLRPDDQLLVAWIGRHPLLSAAELAVLSDQPRALVERRLEWLTRCRVIDGAHVRPHHTSGRTKHDG